MDLLSVRLTINYKDKPPVLDDLCLDLRPGEVLGLVGHSGCGKSSLALAILGLLNLKGGKAARFDSVGRTRVIGAERKRVAQTARQSDFLCAAKPHVCVESGVAAGHTDE